MEENKTLKISLKTLTMIIIVLAIVIIVAIAVILKLKINQTSQNTIRQGSTGNLEITNQTKFVGDFTTKFLQIENNKRNMVYSPLSIKYALNMLKEGAKGNTKSQIESVIGNLPMSKYNSIEKVMSFANGMYVRDWYEKYIIKDYKNTLMGKYNAEIKYDKFESAKNVNKWIEDKTLGIIKDMLEDNIVQDPDTKVLLINALAIDMEWESSFECADTTGSEFKLVDGNIMNATTLKKTTSSENITYYKDNNITALTMPLRKYEDTQLEFTAIMPNENLEEYINTFTMEKFNDIMKKSNSASTPKAGIDIKIPKFKFDYNLKLKDDLIKLGITDAFDEFKADFTNISNSQDGLWVDDVLHKADIEFSEEGVKAAAVTVLIMKDSYMMIRENEPVEIKFDKPFLYVIRDKANEEVWFVGTVYEPNSWDKDMEEYSK